MRTITNLKLALLTGLFVFSSTAFAEQQWLQYKSARDADKQVPEIESKYFEATSKAPDGVGLPHLATDSPPLFFRWESPMVPGGCVYIAFERAQGEMQYDRLYIDSNCDGNLADEEVVQAYSVSRSQAYFAPVRVMFKDETGDPITYHLGICVCGTPMPHLHINAACWYEGDVKVDGKEIRCLLVDYNVNGMFNDKSLDAEQADRIVMVVDGRRTSAFVGNLLQLGGRFYNPKIARDGAFVELAPCDDVKFGTLVVSESIDEISLGGENGLFNMPVKQGRVGLPVGKYSVQRYTIERADNNGNKWKAEAAFGSNAYALDIREGTETKADIGEPFVTKLRVSNRGSGYYSFGQQLEGRMGERLDVRLNGSRPGAPKLWIKNESGDYDRKYSFAYG
jgi:hypothetical protein